MTPTAEDILNQEATEACLTPTQKQLVLAAMHEYASFIADNANEYYDKELEFWKQAVKDQQEETRQLRKDIDKHVLLKSKEAADKAWDGCEVFKK